MTMSNIVTSFQYVTPDGRRLTASLEPSNYDETGPVISTHDPWWILSASPKLQKWMGYMGGDRQLWWTKVHAHWDPGLRVIKMWFEHRGPGGPPDNDPSNLPEANYGPNDINKSLLGHYDWAGRGWHAAIRLAAPNMTPTFEMQPMG
jgi:hypothetical protein